VFDFELSTNAAAILFQISPDYAMEQKLHNLQWTKEASQRVCREESYVKVLAFGGNGSA
jgi:hypothetical protein